MASTGRTRLVQDEGRSGQPGLGGGAVEVGVQEGLDAAVRGARAVGQTSGQLSLTGQDRCHEAVGLPIEVGAGGMIRDGGAEQFEAQRDG